MQEESVIKSFSVEEGDMFYINYFNQTVIIDTNLKTEELKETIINELKNISNNKNEIHFVSTHPDEDHIHGLEYLDENFNIKKFIFVKNEATKDELTPSFKKYIELKKSINAVPIKDNLCFRFNFHLPIFLNIIMSNISFPWPDINNKYFQEELEKVKNGKSPNNISPIFYLKSELNTKFMWFGDMETDFLNKIKEDLILPKTDILFAPHHGRNSGKISADILNKLSPKVIVIGEAPSEDLNYYQGYNTITQNTAGDITFKNCSETNTIDIYVSNENYSVNFLAKKEELKNCKGYIGSLKIS